MRQGLRAKLHHARVTQTEKEYEGSITIDRSLLEAADIAVHEKVQVVNVDNGERFETYTIPGDAGEVCLNGAAARLAAVGDRVIIMAYGLYDDEIPDPTVVRLDETNDPVE
ncbi:Aspartate 1-decarboxylase [Halalkaliarchaeum sp. AArc-CO]|uniref:aspartate 1-decarboxylase n=1 Tax=unclassified Halalkaliarchaeum TaxID=2678344 RepID=UPI00217D902F|nr:MULTISPECIES: aspartate 1-decarboxylase [unclassified Halalkaliarchaeum]MDR5671831.1 aspartate 1-decarboxylase [Halalkaliarchaeum sp. AArc-GB]UWG51334.1 Aspartate 1-decarboxylase [Halalkaliarchaeum sp. AArc-CO]